MFSIVTHAFGDVKCDKNMNAYVKRYQSVQPLPKSMKTKTFFSGSKKSRLFQIRRLFNML